MNGVQMGASVFNVWAQGGAVYQDPMAVAGAVDAAEVLGVHHFDLLVDAYADAFPQEGSELGRLYQDYFENVVAGKHTEAAFQKRQLAGQVRLTNGEKWLEVVGKAGRRVLDGSAFFKESHERFFLETLRGRSVEAPPDPAAVACSTDIAALRSLAEGYYQLALVRLENLIQQGDAAALEVGRTMNPRTIERSGDTPMSQWWLATLAEWGNVQAVWSLTRLKEGGDDYAEEMLADIKPAALARRAEAGKEEAERAVTALAFYNHRAMHVLGDWILEGKSRYAAFLWAAASRDTATTRAIDELARVAGKILSF